MNTSEIDSALDDAVLAIALAASCLEVDPRTTTANVLDTDSALARLEAMELLLCDIEPSESLSLTLLSLRAARADLLVRRMARERSMLAELHSGLARLRAASTLDDLVESIPIEASGLGYERVMFSWIDHELWVPRSMHTTSGPSEAQSILDAGKPPYQNTRELMEVDVVRKRKSILVLDADTNPRVHPKITPVSRSRTYVAAPVVARDHVAGIVHMDRNIETGLNDEFDRDLLALLCQSVGIMLDRLLSSDSVVEQSLPSPVATDWVDVLTPRESEVLRLVADGSTNAQISARLFVSEETTKTHLKKIMRKLGVNNRSQAGAMYHRAHAIPRAGEREIP